MSTRRRLGRGLESLIPKYPEGESEVATIREIPVGKIKANPYQPRTAFDEEKLKELANSIAEHGIIQPLIVSNEPGGYVLVAGERRLRAAQIVGLDKIPCLVRDVDPENKIKLALVENLQRDDLNPIDEAKAYQCLIEEFGFTQEKIARSLGKSRSAIANTLRLLSLPPDVRKKWPPANLTRAGASTVGHRGRTEGDHDGPGNNGEKNKRTTGRKKGGCRKKKERKKRSCRRRPFYQGVERGNAETSRHKSQNKRRSKIGEYFD